jgi:hypothetical protein
LRNRRRFVDPNQLAFPWGTWADLDTRTGHLINGQIGVLGTSRVAGRYDRIFQCDAVLTGPGALDDGDRDSLGPAPLSPRSKHLGAPSGGRRRTRSIEYSNGWGMSGPISKNQVQSIFHSSFMTENR